VELEEPILRPRPFYPVIIFFFTFFYLYSEQ
jgi:hypothetical protein